MRSELAKLFFENPILLTGSDWLMKSFVVLVLAFFVNHVTKRTKLGSSVRHLLWLYSIICLGLIPFAYVALDSVPITPALSEYSFTLTAIFEYTAEPIIAAASNYPLGNILLFFYLLSAGLLLLRILIGVAAVLRISKRATRISNILINEISNKLTENLKLSRQVKLKQSREVTSPFSFGIFFPEIVLPEHAISWSESTLESVLTHELIHIKRLDWLTMLACNVVTCVYWINPLCWFALKRVNEEAELSCDSAVLAQGLNAKSYAESLVYVARQSRDEHRLLVQMMAERRKLPKRISQILEVSVNDVSVASKFHIPLFALCFLLISAFSNFQIISAQAVPGGILAQAVPGSILAQAGPAGITFTSNDFFVPLHVAAPEYPAHSLQDGIDGGHYITFSISKNGTVDPGSITLINTVPPNIFDAASIRAISQFKFEPPYSNGVNIEIPVVRIDIFYSGAEGNVRAHMSTPRLLNREYQPLNYITPVYPPRAIEEKIEGHVLVEFTVTEGGDAAGIVILDRQPSDIFNASAIDAAERLLFQPRVIDGITTEAHGAQYMFLYERNDD
jgi:TonB family protein